MKLLNKLKELNQIELLNKKRMNFAYCIGASIVIIGAWMKITHEEVLGITGNTMLTVGLLTEATIFLLATFETPEPVYDWTKAYPVLKEQDKVERKLYNIKVNEEELKALNRLEK